MPEFHHILFPVDFSHRCHAVRPFVRQTVQRFGAKLTLMHSIQIPTGWYGGFEGAYPVMFDVPTMEEEARQRLGSFFDEPAPGNFEIVVGHGDPAACITTYAEQNDVDLIMMATHGYGKFRSLLLGSATAKVLHDAKCAIWTAAHTEDPDLGEHIECRNILCAIDLTPDSVGLIQQSIDLARKYTAKLRLVHAVPVIETRPEKYLDEDFHRALMESARAEIRKLQHQAGTDVEVCLEGGGVSTVVRAAALHHDADLVVIGRGKLHETLGRLRSNSYAIIRHSPCPVISV
jgi:Universal stress protein UspA and related nucleotide-binding proteins